MDDNSLDSMLDELVGDSNSIDDSIDMDSGIDIDMSDLPDISLSEFDDLGNVDLDDLDLDIDDIDFDDVDITNLDSDVPEEKGRHVKNGSASQKQGSKDDSVMDELDLDDLIAEAEAAEQEMVVNEGDAVDDVFAEALEEFKEDESINAMVAPEAQTNTDAVEEDMTLEEAREAAMKPAEEAAPAAEAGIDLSAELGLDSGMDMGAGADAPAGGEIDLDAFAAEMGGIPDAPAGEAGGGEIDLDELFGPAGSSEGMDENYTKGEDDLDALLAGGEMDDSLADIEDIDEEKPKKKKKKVKGEKGEKKSIKEILFGEPDEDDLEEEAYFEEKKAKKAEAKEKKKAEKEAKSGEKEEEKKAALEVKAKEKSAKKQKAADKKAKKKAALAAELEEEKETKPVPTPVVLIVFVIFAAIGVFVILGTKSFSYAQVIRKASDYFDRQKYRMAYDEVSGVEVKKKDEELKDRIYTVMYVERLYESYQNNKVLGRKDKALDALLRGLEKYDEHYAEAVELGIVSDINNVREKITSALWADYSITEDEAYAVIALEGFDYAERLKKYSGIGQDGDGNELPPDGGDILENNTEGFDLTEEGQDNSEENDSQESGE